ncbi:hypothetical protein A2U01_0050022 [Trifolium medium]|uniref:Uncharacterized protein n=1 Tax=Trifolium medium TaxID=97028 RepID=A0A392QZ23_9FABA|nr:hypothetical protein [Trifolium medium]
MTVRWPLSSSNHQVRSVAPSVATVFSPSFFHQETYEQNRSKTSKSSSMASASHNHGDDNLDTAPPSPPHEYGTVLSPVANDQEQIPVDNIGDPRDGRETSVRTFESLRNDMQKKARNPRRKFRWIGLSRLPSSLARISRT